MAELTAREKAHATLAVVRDIEHDRHRDALELLGKIGLELNAATNEFLTTGVGFVNQWLSGNMASNLQLDPRDYFKDVAMENGLAFIYAVESPKAYHRSGEVDNSIELRIPKSQRLGNLVGGLLLVAHEENQRYMVGRGDVPVERLEMARHWQFFFNAKDGRVIFDNWREQCRTDPVFRIALKLPSVSLAA